MVLSPATSTRLPGLAAAQARALFDASFFPAEVRCTTNNFIIRTAGRTALVDTGAGPFIDDTAGKMLQNAAAAGISPGDIDTILFTHIHPDHISGLLVAGMHLYFPGLTRVRQEGDAFAMVPVPSAYGEFGH